MRDTCLLPEDEGAVPELRRLSVLAAETIGLEVRRRLAYLRPGEGPRTVFDWRVRGGLVEPDQRWKAGLPSYATDIAAALDLAIDANRHGYRVEMLTTLEAGARRCTISLLIRAGFDPPSMWRREAAATAIGTAPEAEAITIAYLLLSRTIHPTLEEVPCPTK